MVSRMGRLRTSMLLCRPAGSLGRLLPQQPPPCCCVSSPVVVVAGGRSPPPCCSCRGCGRAGVGTSSRPSKWGMLMTQGAASPCEGGGGAGAGGSPAWDRACRE